MTDAAKAACGLFTSSRRRSVVLGEVYDLAVLGLGAVGSAALWRAAVRGARAVGIEKLKPGHSFGSSHGGSRIFRRLVVEGHQYVPLARRSELLWRELERVTGSRLLSTTGGLIIGPFDSPLVMSALNAAELGDVEYSLLSNEELAARYPQHVNRSGDIAVYEPGAGVLNPEYSIRAAVSAARIAGADLVLGTRVLMLDDGGSTIVIRSENDIVARARKVILSTGAWIGSHVPQVGLPLSVRRSPLVWFTPSKPSDYSPSVFPVFVRGGVINCWGIPDVDGRGVKIGVSGMASKRTLRSADENNFPVDHSDLSLTKTTAAAAFPALVAQHVMAEPCMDAYTPDGHFLLGARRASPNIVLAGGFSGHGFKHATGSADVAVDLALEGRSTIPVKDFSPERFVSKS